MEELNERVAIIEQDLKSIHRRLDIAEKSAETINKLAVSIERLTVEIQRQRDDIADIKNRMADIESVPKNRWNDIWKIAAGLILGYLFNLIITKGGF